MKKLLLKSLFFIIIWFFILECFFDPRFKRITNFHHTNVEFKDSKKAALDLIFLGSSHAEQSYIPYIFDKVLNINSHNFGCSGQRLVVTNAAELAPVLSTVPSGLPIKKLLLVSELCLGEGQLLTTHYFMAHYLLTG